MHLAIVSPFPPSITGVGQYGYHVTRGLADSGMFNRLTVLAGAENGFDPPNHLGPTEIEYCWKPDQFNARHAILARLKSLRPDLVWFNLRVSGFGRSAWSNLSGLLTPMAARRMGLPTVVTLHELVELANLRTLNAPGGPFAPWGARLLTNITTQADVVCLTMQHYADWLSARRVDCVHIPLGAYHEPALLDEARTPELLFFGMLAPFKGLDLLLEAFTALRAEYPGLRLTVAGAEHPRFPNYARRVKERFDGLPGLQWLGRVDEADVLGLFRSAQIVVLPYAASTGSSSVLYQAATWGRPVVASDLNEIRALAGENDLQVEFFRNGEAGSLQGALRSLLAAPERRRAQAVHNFRSIQGARPEETCRRYLQAFNRALEKHRSPARILVPPARTKPA
jgi:glycosyltransferase involved in cell wall biosynthesis